MSKNYTHLSLVQRYQLEAFVKAGLRQNKIAAELGVHPSTISRELSRNIARGGSTRGKYVASNAQRKTNLRHQHKAKQTIFTAEMKYWALEKLRIEKWSPELISVEGKASGACPVSHEWLYQWIWRCKKGNRQGDKAYKTIYRYLKHGGRRHKRGKIRRMRGTIPDRVPIEKRPAIVKKRKRLGDVEIDLMIGARHKGAVLVMTDRTSLYTQLVKLKTRNSEEVTRGIFTRLSAVPYKLRTLTFDNDHAFTLHGQLRKKLTVRTYFTRPYTSQDKGTVENRIGVLRRFFPKKTDLAQVTARQIREVENKLNNRPVRKFNYQTPKQVLQKKIALIT